MIEKGGKTLKINHTETVFKTEYARKLLPFPGLL